MVYPGMMIFHLISTDIPIIMATFEMFTISTILFYLRVAASRPVNI